MFLATKIAECENIAELNALESMYILNDVESELFYERKVELITRLCEWRYENEQLGLAVDISDSWTPEQRQQFLFDWQNDEPLLEIDRGQKRSYEEMNDVGDEPLLQTGRGQKRSIDEVNDGAGTSDEVSNDNFITMTDVKQVKVKKFNTTGMDYTVQFRDKFAHLELFEFHDRLHEIFESLLNAFTKDIPAHDQVRFVLRSPQLEYLISLPFLPLSRLTTERVYLKLSASYNLIVNFD